MRVELSPRGLGHIDVRLHLDGDGVHAVIVAQHEETRALIASQQHVLEGALERSHVRLSGFSVDVGDRSTGRDARQETERATAGESNGPTGLRIGKQEPVIAAAAPEGLLPAGRVSVRV
jgi:flagellar hook-length control protein FliK